MWPLFLFYAAVMLAEASSVLDVNNISLDFDLETMIKEPATYQPEVFQHALQIVNAMEAAPSCNRLATATLIDSCRSLETGQLGDHKLYTTLDQVKSVFAARLAICELTGAHAVPPSTCASMLPVKTNVDRGFRCLFPGSNCAREQPGRRFEYPKLSSDQIKTCLNALESRPQWWTSYSNARQNAVVICHAARGELEKDELLQLHKDMVSSSSDTSKALADATERVKSAHKEHQKFVEAVRTLQLSVLKDIQLSKKTLSDQLASVMSGVRNSVQQLLEKVTSGTQRAADGLDTLSTNINESNEKAAKLQKTVEETMDSVEEKHKAFADSQYRHLERHEEKALALRDSLDSLHGEQINRLTVAFMGIQTDLASSAQLLTLMHGRQEALEERLLRFTESFRGLEEMASQIANSQRFQGELQNQAFRDLQTMMNQTSNSLDEVHSRMVSLGDTIDQKRKDVEDLNLVGFLGPMFRAVKFYAIAGAGIVLASIVAVKLGRPFYSMSWPLVASVSQLLHLDSNVHPKSHHVPTV